MLRGAGTLHVRSLLLAAIVDTRGVDLAHLTEHDSGVTVEHSNASQTLAVVEGVHHHRLLRHEDHASSIVGLKLNTTLGLLTTGVLTHPPGDLHHAASSTAATDVADRGVGALEGAGNVEDLHVSGEVLGGGDGGVALVDHDVTDTRHVLLVKVLHVHADVVAGAASIDLLVVHLHGEDLARASGGSGVGREEEDLLTRLDSPLLDAAGKHITDTLDLVDAGHWEAHRLVVLALGLLDEVVESILEGGDNHGLLLGDLDLLALPPWHVVGLGEKVVTAPAGDWHDRDLLLDEALRPADLDQHGLHLVADLVVASLGVLGDIAVHLVDTDDELLDTEKVDEVAVTRSIDHGVVVLVGEELLGGALDGHTALALVLLGVHVESESEGALTDALSLLLELGHLALRDTSELEKQAPSGGGLATVDVAANNDGHVSFLCHGFS